MQLRHIKQILTSINISSILLYIYIFICLYIYMFIYLKQYIYISFSIIPPSVNLNIPIHIEFYQKCPSYFLIYSFQKNKRRMINLSFYQYNQSIYTPSIKRNYFNYILFFLKFLNYSFSLYYNII